MHENLAGEFRPGVQIHISQHCVAHKRPYPGNLRMLHETMRGRRRLFRTGDHYHPARKNGTILPGAGDVPSRYQYLLTWYQEEYTAEIEPQSSPEIESDSQLSLDEYVTIKLGLLSHNYLKHMEQNIDDMEAEVLEELKAKIGEAQKAMVRKSPQMSPEERKQFEDHAVHFYISDFRRTLRYSYIVHLVSILETVLKKFCDDLGERKNIDIQLRDLTGVDIVHRFKKFLSIIGRHERLDDIASDFWKPVLDLIQVRNCIVHRLGEVSRGGYEARFRRLAATRQGLSVEDEKILLDKSFCEWALDSVQSFYNRISSLFKTPEAPESS